VRIKMSSPPRFLTLDVNLASKEDLAPLAIYFEEPAFVLGLSKVEGSYYLGLEPCYFSEEENTPENCAKFFIEMVSSFPEELAGLWSRADSRIFDFGFDSGEMMPYYRSEISPEVLGKIASIGASIAMSIYQI